MSLSTQQPLYLTRRGSAPHPDSRRGSQSSGSSNVLLPVSVSPYGGLPPPGLEHFLSGVNVLFRN